MGDHYSYAKFILLKYLTLKVASRPHGSHCDELSPSTNALHTVITQYSVLISHRSIEIVANDETVKFGQGCFTNGPSLNVEA